MAVGVLISWKFQCISFLLLKLIITIYGVVSMRHIWSIIYKFIENILWVLWSRRKCIYSFIFGTACMYTFFNVKFTGTYENNFDVQNITIHIILHKFEYHTKTTKSGKNEGTATEHYIICHHFQTIIYG